MRRNHQCGHCSIEHGDGNFFPRTLRRGARIACVLTQGHPLNLPSLHQLRKADCAQEAVNLFAQIVPQRVSQASLALLAVRFALANRGLIGFIYRINYLCNMDSRAGTPQRTGSGGGRGERWRRGAAWFMRHLVDGDLASNQHGWQWTAGTGTDASPYFRVFNPVSQGKKFDPDGIYVRRYVPELAGLANKFLHEPWLADAPQDDLFDAVGAATRSSYPPPIVEHAAERIESLRRYSAVRAGAATTD